MCLHKGSNKMQTASEDIVCYKIVEIIDGKIKSYFQQSPIKLSIPIEAANPKRKSIMDKREDLTDEVVHSYATRDFPAILLEHMRLMSVAYYATRLSRSCKISIGILECVIPKGTLYCSSILTKHRVLTEYGSAVLIPKKIIDEYEL